jgi:hypothetical protein
MLRKEINVCKALMINMQAGPIVAQNGARWSALMVHVEAIAAAKRQTIVAERGRCDQIVDAHKEHQKGEPARWLKAVENAM